MSEQVVHLEYNEFVMFCMWYFKRYNCKLKFEFKHMYSATIFKIDGNWIFEYNMTNSMIDFEQKRLEYIQIMIL